MSTATKTFDEYFRVFSNYTDKELIAMARPERSDKMERSELHALVQVISGAFNQHLPADDRYYDPDAIYSLERENEERQPEVLDLEERIDALESKLEDLLNEKDRNYWEY